MPKKRTKAEFIAAAKKVHGDQYDYSDVEYVDSSTKVLINCRLHGGFEQTPAGHVSGQGCRPCGTARTARLKKQKHARDFANRASAIHGNKYDYSKVEYAGNEAKVIITCPSHGDFEQTPHGHLAGNGCQACGVETVRSKLTGDTATFIQKAEARFPQLFDYSRVHYTRNYRKVIISCKKHGDFRISPNHFLKSDYGCQKCGVAARSEQQSLTRDQFIARANSRHDFKYDYSKTVYNGTRFEVMIRCPQHELEFTQVANSHLSGNGCPACGKETTQRKRRTPVESFIRRASEIHGGKYDYSDVEYVNNRTAITVICSEHGPFATNPSNHLTRRSGCPTCASESLSARFRMSSEEFIERAAAIHGQKYKYELSGYANRRSVISVGCPVHGWYRQRAGDHLSGNGCPDCGLDSLRQQFSTGLDEFVRRAREIHGDKYDYERVRYINGRVPVEIICPIHGTFTQKPQNHTLRKAGCWSCSDSKGEREIARWLESHQICFEREKTFPTLRHKGKLRFDFCISLMLLLIEYDGEQHFAPANLFGGKKEFRQTQLRDQKKNEWAARNGWRLERIRWDEDVDARLQQIFDGFQGVI